MRLIVEDEKDMKRNIKVGMLGWLQCWWQPTAACCLFIRALQQRMNRILRNKGRRHVLLPSQTWCILLDKINGGCVYVCITSPNQDIWRNNRPRMEFTVHQRNTPKQQENTKYLNILLNTRDYYIGAPHTRWEGQSCDYWLLLHLPMHASFQQNQRIINECVFLTVCNTVHTIVFLSFYLSPTVWLEQC